MASQAGLGVRILFFIHGLTAGGAERVAATLANFWAGQGHDVVIVTLRPSGDDFYPLHAGVRRRVLELGQASPTATTALLANLARVAALRRALVTERPAGAIAMMPTANALLALAGVGTGVTVRIGAERLHPPQLPLGRAWRILRALTYPLLDRLVAQTPASASWLARHTWMPADRIAVIANPVIHPLPCRPPHVSLADIRARCGCTHLLLAVGRLDPAKGFDRLIDAFASVAAGNPTWGLVILGEGPAREQLAHRVRRHELADRVVLPGVAGNVGACYTAADAYALTSRAEGFPNALLEALAHGLPAVAVDCETGPREIIQPEVNGVLVPENDDEALRAALARVMGDRGLRARLAARAVEVRARFAVAEIAARWTALLACPAIEGQAAGEEA